MEECRQKCSMVPSHRRDLTCSSALGQRTWGATQALGEQDGSREDDCGAHAPGQPDLWAPSMAGLGMTLGVEGGRAQGAVILHLSCAVPGPHRKEIQNRLEASLASGTHPGSALSGQRSSAGHSTHRHQRL